MVTGALSMWKGEFLVREREAAFRALHLGENLRYARLAFLASAILHILFLPSDWRFAGTPHFWVAVPIRVTLIVASFVFLASVWTAKSYRRIEALLIAWMAVTAIGSALLATTHSDIALFAVLLIPLIFYLVISVSFVWTLICGAGGSALMLTAFLLPDPPSTGLGLIVIVACMNVAFGIAVSRSNRLRRLEWAARVEVGESRRTLETVFNATPVPITITRFGDGSLVRANDAAHAFFGTTPETAATSGAGYADPSTRAYLVDQVARRGHVASFESRMRLVDGSVRDVLMAANRVTLGDDDCLMTGLVDITTRKLLEAHLEAMATTDSLTGLANRTRFFSAAAAEIRRAVRTGRRPSLLMIDLDHFKAINDAHGHEAGDQALRAFAELAVGLMREHDTAARLGGEEFAVLLPDTDLPSATKLAERLRAEIEAMRIDALPALRLTISIGVARVEDGESAADPALSRADRALYRAKRAGRNRVSVVEARLDASQTSRQD